MQVIQQDLGPMEVDVGYFGWMMETTNASTRRVKCSSLVRDFQEIGSANEVPIAHRTPLLPQSLTRLIPVVQRVLGRTKF